MERENLIKIQRRTKYGKDLIFPVNRAAKLLVKLTGRKTFFAEDLMILELLGFELEDVPRSVDVIEDPDPLP